MAAVWQGWMNCTDQDISFIDHKRSGECVSHFQVTKIDFLSLKTFMGYRIIMGILMVSRDIRSKRSGIWMSIHLHCNIVPGNETIQTFYSMQWWKVYPFYIFAILGTQQNVQSFEVALEHRAAWRLWAPKKPSRLRRSQVEVFNMAEDTILDKSLGGSPKNVFYWCAV